MGYVRKPDLLALMQ